MRVLTYRAVWPHVLGLEPVQVVVVRDPEGKMKDTYLLSTAAGGGGLGGGDVRAPLERGGAVPRE